MAGHPTSVADLWWLALLPLALVSFVIMRRPNRTALATSQGWIPGILVFAISWAAARLWPRRAPL